jgi:hypothetical protein
LGKDSALSLKANHQSTACVLVNKGVGLEAGAAPDLSLADCAPRDVTHNKITANANGRVKSERSLLLLGGLGLKVNLLRGNEIYCWLDCGQPPDPRQAKTCSMAWQFFIIGPASE